MGRMISIASLIRPSLLSRFSAIRLGHSHSSSKPHRKLIVSSLGSGKSGGRNSGGRITSFHRGGGSKRLHRKIDLKRSTSSMGVVEKIEYDPNRSARIACIRWIEGVEQEQPKKLNTKVEFTPPPRFLEPNPTTIRGLFSFSSLPGKVTQRNQTSSSPGLKAASVVVGLPDKMPRVLEGAFTSDGTGGHKMYHKDIFVSAFSSAKAKEKTAPASFASAFSFPRIAVAGAKSPFFAPQLREDLREKESFSLCEIRKWDSQSSLWAHRIKRKAALSWQSFRPQGTLELAGAVEPSKWKLKL